MNNFKIKFSAATAVGKREINQDIFLADKALSSADSIHEQYFENVCMTTEGLKVFALCDGIGSYKNSGFAAHAALSRIREDVAEYNKNLSSAETEESYDFSEVTKEVGNSFPKEGDLRALTITLLENAKKSMLKFCYENNYNGSSSTIAILAIKDDDFVFANIGDSPCFLKNAQGEFKELSLRHNLATYKRLLNDVAQEGDERILLYHLGDKSSDVVLTANVVAGKLSDKDAFIICSDGVATIDVTTMSDMLSEQKASYKFVEMATGVEDADNCTAITVYIDGENIQ